MFFFLVGFTGLIFLLSNFTNNGLAIFNVDSSNTTGSLSQRIIGKVFSDRIPLWSSASAQIFNDFNILPPIEVGTIRLLYYTQVEHFADYGSHNLLLELVRVNGFIIGLIIFFNIFL
ncbi:MAG: hypothetical protein IPN31_16400 [Bacteroidetes bacterium]|nr:hypothetical protein [Bacteroidota bacterium]